MVVYNLPTEPVAHVLLTGDDDFVREFAGILAKNDVTFDILPPIDEEEILHVDEETASELADIDISVYSPFQDRLIADPREATHAYTHIIDLSVELPTVRRTTLVLATSVHPKATVIASTLTTTATELGMIAGIDKRIVGIGLVPMLMSTTTVAECAPGLNTTADHIASADLLLQKLGYVTEHVEDRVALVQMRILATLINEAAFAVMEGVASPEDIDLAMQLGTGYPKGLLAWADEIGIPIVTLVLDGLYHEYRQERYRPCVLLKQYMRAGWTGKESGRGFYTYTSDHVG
ncbi:MAG: 3-hydroxyacyl-CoA dehydrogenase family protein [bacterium]|nr:3-hydroxyacyl-CoA dehydrogenase family protein [bacterium]